MTISKSILLTLILALVFFITQIGFMLLLDNISINENLKLHYGITIILSTILSYLIVIFWFWKPKVNFNLLLESKNVNLNIFFLLIITAFGLKFLTRPFLDFNEITDYYLNNDFNTNYYVFTRIDPNFIYTYFIALIISPFLEELFFRKFIFKRLLKNYALSTAIIVSSILFALPHIPDYENLFPTFIFGLAAGLVYYKTNKIIHCIILHFIYNFLTLLLDIYGETIYKKMYELEFNYVYWSIFIIGIFITFFGLKKIKTANN